MPGPVALRYYHRHGQPSVRRVSAELFRNNAWWSGDRRPYGRYTNRQLAMAIQSGLYKQAHDRRPREQEIVRKALEQRRDELQFRRFLPRFRRRLAQSRAHRNAVTPLTWYRR